MGDRKRGRKEKEMAILGVWLVGVKWPCYIKTHKCKKAEKGGRKSATVVFE